MKRSTIGLIGILLLSAFVTGCKGEDDGVDHEAVSQHARALSDPARKAGGNWDKLSEQEKKLFLDANGGNEAQAKDMVKTMGTGGGQAATGPGEGKK